MRELDIGIKLDGTGLGTKTSWDQANEFLYELYDLIGDGHSAGTGFGVRDAQFTLLEGSDEAAIMLDIKERAKKAGIELVYVDCLDPLAET